MWVHCPRASNGLLPRRSNLVGYVRWDAQSDRFPPCQTIIPTAFRSQCGVEVWRGGLGRAYLLPTLSFVGASLAPPCFRFHTPLIEPDVRICRIRLSKKTHAITEAIACDAVCNF